MNNFNHFFHRKKRSLQSGNRKISKEKIQNKHALKRRHSLSMSDLSRLPDKENVFRQETKRPVLRKLWDHFKNGYSSFESFQNRLNARRTKMGLVGNEENHPEIMRLESSDSEWKSLPEESKRLEEDKNDPDQAWREWGPFLSERQWGTVREDYSKDGAWFVLFTFCFCFFVFFFVLFLSVLNKPPS